MCLFLCWTWKYQLSTTFILVCNVCIEFETQFCCIQHHIKIISKNHPSYLQNGFPLQSLWNSFKMSIWLTFMNFTYPRECFAFDAGLGNCLSILLSLRKTSFTCAVPHCCRIAHLPRRCLSSQFRHFFRVKSERSC